MHACFTICELVTPEVAYVAGTAWPAGKTELVSHKTSTNEFGDMPNLQPVRFSRSHEATTVCVIHTDLRNGSTRPHTQGAGNVFLEAVNAYLKVS